MTISESNFLDVGNLLIFEIVGSVSLFIIIGLIVLNFYIVKRNLPIQVNLFASFLFIGAVVSYVYNALVFTLALLVFGIIIYSQLPKLFKR